MKLALILATFINTVSYAGPTWDRLIKASGLNPAHNNYCYFDDSGEIQGANVHKKAYLASVSKLVTTFAVAKKMGVAFKHQTTFFYDPESKSMHIQGGMDPLFTFEKTFFLVNQFNHYGITEIKNLTYDDKTLFWPKSHWDRQNSPVITHAQKSKFFYDYLHTPEWNVLLTRYKEFYKRYQKDTLDFLRINERPEELNLAIGKVNHSASAPFDIEKDDILKLVHLSPEIENFLKYMNVLSHNYYADEYLNVVGNEEFQKILTDFMEEHFPNYKNEREGFKADEPTIGIFNGSGLPDYRTGSRKDNFATCAVIITMIREMDKEIQAMERKIEESIAVTGIDLGTIKNRLRGERIKDKAVVKTGTTNPVSALAGMMNTRTGRRYFGIFNHRQMGGGRLSAGPLRALQNEIAYKLMSDFEGGEDFGYRRKYLNVLDSNLIQE